MSHTHNLTDAAEKIGNVSADQLKQWLRAGKIAGHKVGRRWVMTDSDIAEFLDSSYRPAQTKQAANVTEFALTSTSRRRSA